VANLMVRPVSSKYHEPEESSTSGDHETADARR